MSWNTDAKQNAMRFLRLKLSKRQKQCVSSDTMSCRLYTIHSQVGPIGGVGYRLITPHHLDVKTCREWRGRSDSFRIMQEIRETKRRHLPFIMFQRKYQYIQQNYSIEPFSFSRRYMCQITMKRLPSASSILQRMLQFVARTGHWSAFSFHQYPFFHYKLGHSRADYLSISLYSADIAARVLMHHRVLVSTPCDSFCNHP